MTTEEAGARFGIDAAKLKYYEQQGLLDCHKKSDGSIDYSDDMADYLAIINLLLEVGAQPAQLRSYMQGLMQSSITKQQKLCFLSRQRSQLLADIHSKQKTLDKLDYMIHQTKNANP